MTVAPSRRRPTEALPWLALSLLVWGAGLTAQRLRATPTPDDALPSWQRSFRELGEADQRTYRHLRESLYELERHRAETGRWPEPATLRDAAVEPFHEDERSPAREWTLRTHGVYATYVGVPRPPAGAARFVVVYVEPPPEVLAAGPPPPPDDEEHHTLADGTPVHVTVWTQADGPEPVPDEVLAFPAAQGWVQRLAR